MVLITPVLEAYAAHVNKAPAPTVERLTAIADSTVRGWDDFVEPLNMLISDLWESLGKPDRALIAIRRRQYSLGNPRDVGLAAALRREGRLAAATGDRDGAIHAYEHYLVMRRKPDPLLIPQRDSVIAELGALNKR